MSSAEMNSVEMSSAREPRFIIGGADDPDQLIGVAAGELLEWGWLIGALADWLTDDWLAETPDPTRADTGADAVAADEFSRYFAGHPTRERAAWMLDHIAERIGGLLDGDRGQS